MIRYSIVLSTSQSAVNHANRGGIPVAQVARKRNGGLPEQTGCGTDALYLDGADLDQFDADRSDLDCPNGIHQQEQVDLPMHQIMPTGFMPTGLPVVHFRFSDLPLDLPLDLLLGRAILGQQLGQRLKERPWCPRSGRYKCVTVPKQD